MFVRTLTANVVTHLATMARSLVFVRTLTATVVASTVTMLRGMVFARTLSALSSAAALLGRYRSFGLPFLYTTANWSGTPSIFFEVFMRATSGTARARLYNETDAVAVTNSDVSTASVTYVRIRSAALTLTDGKVYVAQFGTEDGAGGFKGAKIIVL